MKYTDKQIEHIQYAFRTFCKKVLCHEAINAYRYLQRRERRETSLDALCSLEPAAAFMEQEIADSFTVRGEVFFVANEQLAARASGLAGAAAGNPVSVFLLWVQRQGNRHTDRAFQKCNKPQEGYCAETVAQGDGGIKRQWVKTHRFCLWKSLNRP